MRNFVVPKGKNNTLEGTVFDMLVTHIHTRTLLLTKKYKEYGKKKRDGHYEWHTDG